MRKKEKREKKKNSQNLSFSLSQDLNSSLDINSYTSRFPIFFIHLLTQILSIRFATHSASAKFVFRFDRYI